MAEKEDGEQNISGDSTSGFAEPGKPKTLEGMEATKVKTKEKRGEIS